VNEAPTTTNALTLLLKQLNHFLPADWRDRNRTTMDRRLFDILWEVYRAGKPRRGDAVSDPPGARPPPARGRRRGEPRLASRRCTTFDTPLG